jgi:putative ATPase
MQDTFLPHVENGTITLLGATTENPSFQLNSALLSRCKVIVLEKLSSASVECLLSRALPKLNVLLATDKQHVSTPEGTVWIDEDALRTLADLSDGDARRGLNGLQLAVQAKRALLNTSLGDIETSKLVKPPDTGGSDKDDESLNRDCVVSVEDVRVCLQRTHLVYDRGDERYHCISALHKSMRGSDANASLYWLARMLCAGEDPLYVARRVINFASEDVGEHGVNIMIVRHLNGRL